LPAFPPAAADIEQKPAAVTAHVQRKRCQADRYTGPRADIFNVIPALTAGYAQNFWIGA
jgi:hypothetical protein